MGEEKWIRRRPGSISGTVVPPPAQDEVAPPSTGQAASAHARKPPRARAEPAKAPAAEQPPAQAEPAGATYGIGEAMSRLPDSLRSHFQPVLSRPPQPPPEPPAGIPEPPAPIAARPARTVTGTRPAIDGTKDGPPDRPAPELRRPGSRRGVALVVLVLAAVLLTAGTTVALLGRHRPAGQQRPAISGADSASLAAATAARTQAARWMAREISRSAIIGCDTVMCAALENAGIPSSDLLVIRPTAPDPLGADVIVATPVLRSQFGSRLNTEYAPAVLATFGAGPAKVQVRVVAVDGAAAYESALRRDIAARRSDGAALLANRRISMPSAAKVDLAAGLVDPRLLVILPALAAAHPIRIIGFYDQAPRSSPGVPLAGVWLSGADRQAGLPAPAYRRWLLSFLRSQQSTYLPTSITTTVLHGRPVVAVRFARPNPLGLLQS